VLSLIAPAGILFFIFVALPFVFAIVISFTNLKLIQTDKPIWIGAENYLKMFSVLVIEREERHPGEGKNNTPARDWRETKRNNPAKFEDYQYLGNFDLLGSKYLIVAKDPQFIKAVINTTKFVLIVVPLQTLVALLMALWVNKEFKGRTALRAVFFAPVVTSMVVVSAIWGLLLHGDAGLINQALRSIFGPNAPQPDWLLDKDYALVSIAVMSAWQGAGFQMLIFLAGLQGIPKENYEAAEVMGASKWQTLMHVTLPSLSRTISLVVVSTTIAAFGLFTQVDILTGGGPQDSTTTIIYHAVQVGFREQSVAYGSAISLFFFLLVLGLTLIQKRLMERKSRRKNG
jgi:multiple sugar transport system permease protein